MTYSSEESLPPLQAIEAVLVVSRVGSLSGAALELGVSHAALSRRISQAEAWAGAVLFERHGRGMRATIAGQRVATRAAAALDQLASLRSAAPRSRALATVTLAATPSFARYWLFQRLAELEGNPRDLRIELVVTSALTDVAGGQADLAIRFGHGAWPNLASKELLDGRIVPVVASTVATPARGDVVTFVRRQALLHAADLTLWRRWHAEHGLPLRTKEPDRTLTDYALALDAATAGLGAALWLPSLHPLPPGLRALQAAAARGSIGYHLVFPRSESTAPVARLMARLLAMSKRR